MDLCFLVDMFIQALMGYLDRKRNRWEVRPRVTIKRYCCTWLLPDVVSVVPYDAIAFCLPNYTVAKLKVMAIPAGLLSALRQSGPAVLHLHHIISAQALESARHKYILATYLTA